MAMTYALKHLILLFSAFFCYKWHKESSLALQGKKVTLLTEQNFVGAKVLFNNGLKISLPQTTCLSPSVPHSLLPPGFRSFDWHMVAQGADSEILENGE